MNTRLMLRSIVIAVGLTFGLGLLFALAILIARQVDDNGGDNNGGDKSCRFTGTSEILTVYQAPVTDATQHLARLSGVEAYPVVQQRTQHVLIQLRDSRTAWVDRRSGTLAGDCSSIPVDNTPLEGFPTLCTFTSPVSVPLYSNSALTGQVGTLPPGTFPLIGVNRDRYYVYLDANQGGWVLGNAGVVAGNCVMVPARPG